jgi:hypothetical protein
MPAGASSITKALTSAVSTGCSAGLPQATNAQAIEQIVTARISPSLRRGRRAKR